MWNLMILEVEFSEEFLGLDVEYNDSRGGI